MLLIKTRIWKLELLVTMVVISVNARTIPKVPAVVHPPVPEEARLSLDDLDLLEEQDPEVTPGLFQGDMALTDEMYDYWRVGLRWDVFPEKMWPNNTVPYVISPLYDTTDYVTIYQAITIINTMTCVRFVPWNGKDKDYLLIWPIKYPKGCWSYVGRFGGPQIVSLQPPDNKSPNCLGSEGRSIHELLHAIGIFHEQARADRDEYVQILTDNIIPAYSRFSRFLLNAIANVYAIIALGNNPQDAPGYLKSYFGAKEYRNNFKKQSLENTTYIYEYDYDSIMHYGKFFFSKSKGAPTIVPKKGDVKLGQRKALSKMDCLKVNDLYGCLKKSVYHRRKYQIMCNFLGY